MRRLLLAGLVVVWGTLGVDAATYYFDWTSGNDANNGTSKATAKKRHFYMKGYSGPAYSHSVGDIFVFKGGETWPVSCFQMNITLGGTSGNQDQYTVDPTWFTGGAFSRPLFDFQHTLVGPGWLLAAGVLIQANDVYFNNIEIANHRVPLNTSSVSTWGSFTITISNADRFTLTNCLIRDFDQPAAAPGQKKFAGGGGVQRVNNGVGHVIRNCEIHQSGVAAKNGVAVWNIGEVSFTSIHDTASAFQFGQLFHDNHVYNLVQPTDEDLHSNVVTGGGSITSYNNKIHDIDGRAQIHLVSPGLDGAGVFLAYNNVIWNVAQPPFVIDTDGQNNAGAIARIFNNTVEGQGGTGYCVRFVYRSNGPFPTAYVQNNHFLTSGQAVGRNNLAALDAPVTSYTEANTIQMTVSQANALGYTDANALAPTDASKPTVVAATDESAFFNTDRLGNPRPNASGLWNVGAYSFVPTTGVPGTIVFSAASVSVSEADGSVILTANRTGGTSGAVTVQYATANGTAAAGVNYTSTSGTLTWLNGDATSKTFNVTILDANMDGSKSFTSTLSSPTGGASLGTPVTQTVTVNGTGTPAIVLLTGPVFSTPSSLSTPFVQTGSYYSQTIETTDPANSGIADYYFTNALGTYNFYATVIAPSEAQNSIFWTLNGTPISPNNVWDIRPISAVQVEYPISARGPNGTPDFSATNAIQAVMQAGVTNHIQVRGREPDVRIYSLRYEKVADPVNPPVIVSTSIDVIDGYYKNGATIDLSLSFDTNVTVVGTPSISLNSGGTATFSGGSGTKVLTFSYPVTTGENTQSLDYSSTGALSLNGGSIKFGSIDANLTLPVPGEANSMSFGRSVVIDTIAPTISISSPSSTLSPVGSTIFYTITYDDLNFSGNSLVAADVTLNGATTGTIIVGPNNFGPSTSVTLDNLTVGTGSISIGALTAVDLAGNLAPAAGPSVGFSVSSAFGGTANVISTSAGVIIANP